MSTSPLQSGFGRVYLISMNDLTREERSTAAMQNWGLFHVFDLDKRRWSMNVLPLTFDGGISAEKCLRFVIERARGNDSVALKALRLMAAFNAGKAGKTRRKR